VLEEEYGFIFMGCVTVIVIRIKSESWGVDRWCCWFPSFSNFGIGL